MAVKTRLVIAACLVAMLTGVRPVRAEEFAPPTLATLVKAFVRFGVFDVRKDDVIDFYGKVTECKIFRENYLDDFKWQRVRAALRAKIKQDIATFPTGVAYQAQLQLDKYDFRSKLYRFSEKTAQVNANVFRISVDPSNFCTNDTRNILPREYRFVLDQPVHLSGIPMSEREGQELLSRLREAKNKDLIIYTKFNMRITYVQPLEVVADDHRDKFKFNLNRAFATGIRLDAALDSVEYYEDPKFEKLIYRFMP